MVLGWLWGIVIVDQFAVGRLELDPVIVHDLGECREILETVIRLLFVH